MKYSRGGGMTNPTVHIIDDDEAIVAIIKKALEMEGFTDVKVAATGEEALKELQIPSMEGTATVQLTDMKVIILDIMLPDVNGFDLCRKIKDSFSDTLVLLVSGFNIDDLHKKIIESDADDFLTKPFSPLELVARLDLLIKKHNKYKNIPTNANTETRNNLVPHIGDAIDDYHIIDSLGWGKSSIIYKVVEKQTKKVFALKLLTRHAMEFKDVVERFEHEVHLMARLDHPNVISFYKMGDYSGCPYILMDYVYGINLEEFLVTKGRPDTKTFFKIMEQTASAIEAIHKAGVIHRDIKLKNIMLEVGKEIVKLTDFGIAMAVEEGSDITRDGFIVGTPIYMAPEMFQGSSATVKSDIYSFGVTFYQFATGSPPFVAKSNADLYDQHKSKLPLDLLEKTDGDFPIELNDLIKKHCMAKKPADRPDSMSEIISELRSIKRKYQSLV